MHSLHACWYSHQLVVLSKDIKKITVLRSLVKNYHWFEIAFIDRRCLPVYVASKSTAGICHEHESGEHQVYHRNGYYHRHCLSGCKYVFFSDHPRMIAFHNTSQCPELPQTLPSNDLFALHTLNQICSSSLKVDFHVMMHCTKFKIFIWINHYCIATQIASSFNYVLLHLTRKLHMPIARQHCHFWRITHEHKYTRNCMPVFLYCSFSATLSEPLQGSSTHSNTMYTS